MNNADLSWVYRLAINQPIQYNVNYMSKSIVCNEPSQCGLFVLKRFSFAIETVQDQMKYKFASIVKLIVAIVAWRTGLSCERSINYKIFLKLENEEN